MKSTKPKLNVKLLRRIKEHLLEEPRRLEMSGFGYKTDFPSKDEPPCGTVGCIAGWAVWLSGLDVRNVNVSETAAKLLGLQPHNEEGELSGDQKRLFYTDTWPRPFERRHDTAKTARGRATATAARIEHFISTRE